jgi:TolB-like protein/DNA-binding winged helix-turn-helix (wHTH) protein/Tfp pilus assembly protein PilF
MQRDGAGETVRFGHYELNSARAELRRGGVRIRLEGQPLQILSMLVARQGEPVSREELRQALWPTESFGDFDRNLNSAVKRLRAALDDSGRSPRYVERLRKRGYRLMVPVLPVIDGAAADVPASELPAVPVRPSWILRWRWAAVAALGAVAVASGAWAYVRWSGEQLRKSIRAIAVLPFDAANADGADASDYIAFGLTEAVTIELSKLNGIRVASAARWGRHPDRTVADLARLLGVNAVLDGSVVQEGTRVRVNVQLIDAASSSHLWADSYTREATSLLNLQTEIAQAVAREVRLTIAPPERPKSIPMVAIVDPVAERAYLEGRYHANRGTPEDWTRAREAFERALVRRPKHVAAHTALANLYLSSESLPPAEILPKAREHAMTALSINDKVSDTHVALGVIAIHDWDWDGARRSFERALALSPGNIEALQWLARLMGALGRTDEALAETRRAVQMEPVSLIALERLAHEELRARQYRRAFETAGRIVSLEPRDARGHTQLAASQALLGQYDGCLVSVDMAARSGGRTAQLLAYETYCLGRAGRHTDAERTMAELDALAGRAFVPAYFQAVAAIGLGQLDRAVRDLERGYARRDYQMVELKMSPWLEAVRGQPAVQRLLKEMHFPQ